MNSSFVIASLAPPGVVIQLDGRGAKRLAMTLQEFIACFTCLPASFAASQ